MGPNSAINNCKDLKPKTASSFLATLNFFHFSKETAKVSTYLSPEDVPFAFSLISDKADLFIFSAILYSFKALEYPSLKLGKNSNE
ncbi:hypothetical protein CXF68_09100 [Tenacibaculum sp. Bg11-29]|nr:hypothetical protein CXF68_09100 [Tenacibaculum sp. Bg11-29]